MKKSTIIVKILHALLSVEQQRDALTGELTACEDELSETLQALANANKQLTQPREDGSRERIKQLEDANTEHIILAANAGANIKLLEATIELLEATIKQHATTIKQLGGRVEGTEIDTRKGSPCDMGGCD